MKQLPPLHRITLSLSASRTRNTRPILFLLFSLGIGLMGLQSSGGAPGTFSVTGDLVTGRSAHTATLLSNGKVLVAGGFESPGTIILSSAELYDPATGSWSTTGSLTTARAGHTATLLPSGQVLVAAGYGGGATAELYDPATGTWSATGSLAITLISHTATLLAGGQVLVAGGFTPGGQTVSAELYNPATGSWSATGNLATARDRHTATLLAGGQVLVAGGETDEDGTITATAELYHPATGTWSTTGSLAEARESHTATLLSSGKVLVAGGFNNGFLISAELYDPAIGTWSATGNLAMAHGADTANLLPSGNVLVAGGFDGFSFGASAELYDPAAGKWSTTGSLKMGRAGHTATSLVSGQVLVAGGDGAPVSAELYDPPATPPPTPTPSPSPSPSPSPQKLLNISTRLNVQIGDNVLIGGFIVTGMDAKNVLVRGIGPSLSAFGVSGALADPVLELHKPDGTIVTNDNWKATQEAEITATGLQPSNDIESAILATLAPGAYTAILRGNSDGTGVGLVEAYDLDQTGNSILANISTRGLIQTGDNVMIGGFIVGGGDAGEVATVVVRGIGPSLTPFGVVGALADPTLELHDVNGALLAANDNWKNGPDEQTIIDDGLAPTNDAESALLATLAPGAYTAIVSGVGDTTGVGLVEAYNVVP